VSRVEEKVRAVLVGCGGISAAWLNSAREIPDLEVVGLVDLREEAARRRAEEFGLGEAVIGDELGSVLERTSPDVVFNCTVPEAHFSVTLEALESGCHVLSEKPLAESMQEAKKLIAASRGAGKLFAVIQNRRYEAGIRRLRALLESGKLGPLTTLNTDFYIGAHFGGFRDHMEHVLLLDMAIHTFDAARLISGADPVSVYCEEWNPEGSWYDRDASAVAIFHMTGGLVYTYRGSWCAEGENTSWAGDWRAVCRDGSVHWDGEEGFEAQVVTATGGFHSELAPVEVPQGFAPEKVGLHGAIMREFIRCMRTGEEPETIATDNVKSLAMVLGAVESARTGKRVEIEW
jgi:predicted dehydrogenase